jgi:hypothetical protein
LVIKPIFGLGAGIGLDKTSALNHTIKNTTLRGRFFLSLITPQKLGLICFRYLFVLGVFLVYDFVFTYV